MSGDYISRATAIKSTWMILEGMGYPRSENRSLEKTVEAVFKSAPAADVVERPRWIHVTERFPKWSETVYEGEPCIDGELVLVFAPKGEADKAWNNMAVGSWLGDRWEVLDDAFTLNAITHWMPLPEPPKEEE